MTTSTLTATPRRVVICGGPRAGKTTLGTLLSRTMAGVGAPLTSTDDHMALGWSEASAESARVLGAPGPWILEGVAAVRALRKWMATHGGKPCDLVVWLDAAVVPRTAGQEAMAKGCATVWAGVKPELVRRGVEVQNVKLRRSPTT
jgi:hypothetical protein